MFKRIYLFTLLLFLSGSVVFAQTNSILNTTVRKTADNKLNLTFFTKGESVEKPVVKDKGNNQYVILLPNLVDNAGRRPDLRNATDMVSDVNVKTINEGAVTYTKVSITTKKPVTINAETRRTSQSAGELSGVNDIISKVNLISEDIQASKNIQPVQPVENTVSSLPKMNSIQDILNNKNVIGTIKPAVVEVVPTPVPTAPAPIKTVSAHVPPNTSAIKADAKKLKNENIKNVRQNAVSNINKIEKNIKSSVENNVTVNDEEPETVVPPVNTEAETSIQEIVPETSAVKTSRALGSPIALITSLVLGALLIAMFIIGKMKSVLADSEEINASFVQRMNSAAATEKKDLSGLAQNTELNWQEKYQSLKGVEKEKQQAIVDTHIGVEPDEDLDIVEDYVEEEDLPQIVEPEPLNPFAASVVRDSADSISTSMKRSLKLADDSEINLAQTKRNSGLKNRFKGFASNPVLERNINELLDTVIQMEDVVAPVLAVESVPEPEPIVEPVIEKLEEPVAQQIVEEPQIAPQVVEHASLPIQKPKKKMKIMQSRAIDDNKGFYLVDMEDKLALMGRINDKFTVLKKFDEKDKETLQVRRDKDNLYMVRTDGFKALVDVAETRMGVLAEL